MSLDRGIRGDTKPLPPLPPLPIPKRDTARLAENAPGVNITVISPTEQHSIMPLSIAELGIDGAMASNVGGSGNFSEHHNAREVNEDCVVSISKDGHLYHAVIDGIGGHAAGEIAALIVGETVIRTVETADQPLYPELIAHDVQRIIMGVRNALALAPLKKVLKMLVEAYPDEFENGEPGIGSTSHVILEGIAIKNFEILAKEPLPEDGYIQTIDTALKGLTLHDFESELKTYLELDEENASDQLNSFIILLSNTNALKPVKLTPIQVDIARKAIFALIAQGNEIKIDTDVNTLYSDKLHIQSINDELGTADSISLFKGRGNRIWRRSVSMGAVGTIVSIYGDIAEIVHAGDSRAYHYRDQLEQITEDATYPQFLQKLIDVGDFKGLEMQLAGFFGNQGNQRAITDILFELKDEKKLKTIEGAQSYLDKLDPGEKAVYVQRHTANRVLSNFGGDAGQPNIIDDFQTVSYEREFVSGDVLLLCSDGLTDYVDNDFIAATLKKVQSKLLSPVQAVNLLITEAKTTGGHDNITVSILFKNSNRQ